MRHVTAMLVLLVLAAAPDAFDDGGGRFADVLERPFAPGGTVTLDLSAGDYRVGPGQDHRIRVAWRTSTAEHMSDVRVRAVVRDGKATVRTSGPGRDFRVAIDLPSRSDLLLRMSAGNLTISGIDGHKDVRLRAGNLDIEMADPVAYAHVAASVTAGDLLANPFGFSTGGLFRSFRHEGPGRYDLRARVWAGNLRLVRAGSDPGPR